MKPTIQKRKNARGHITGYQARLGPIIAAGDTPKAAELALDADVLAALRRLDHGHLIGRWRDHIYVVSPTTEGWAYWIDLFENPRYNVACGGSNNRDNTENAALNHLAKLLWSTDVLNDSVFVHGLPPSVITELLPYFAWQREYARLSAAGHSDGDARMILSGHHTGGPR